MHPVNEIRGTKWTSLENKKILIGITGSAASYKAIDLARELIKRGATVRALLSKSASEMITPKLVGWATGLEPVVEESWVTEHITFAYEYDAFLVAPATLNAVVKISLGITDELIPLTAISFLGMGKKVIVAPALHKNLMGLHYKNAIDTLREMGVKVIEPIVDSRAKFPDVESIANVVEGFVLRGEDFKYKKVLVTSGPTREYLDSVRFISNPSSGKMGASLAWEAFARGAEVKVISGPSCANYPPWVPVTFVETTEEMIDEVSKEEYDIAFLAAAPSDYKPERRFEGKLKENLEIKLLRTEKVSSHVKAKIKVGFTAVVAKDEEELVSEAEKKLEEHGFDMIVANNVARKDIGFESDMNEVIIVRRDGKYRHVPKMPKLLVARAVLDEVRDLEGRATSEDEEGSR